MPGPDLKHINLLAEYLPQNTVTSVWEYIKLNEVRFRIAKPRKTKLGDYRPAMRGQPHRISVNADLNPYAFLLTTLHEFAHLDTWEVYRQKVKPHGIEWKRAFQSQLQPYFDRQVFPESLETAIRRYIANPAASSCSDHSLSAALSEFDEHQSLTLREVPEGTRFRIHNNMVFEKGPLLRKRYKCLCITNKRQYYVSAAATITLVDPQLPLL